MSVSVCVYLCLCTRARVWLRVHLCVCICMCMCVYVCVQCVRASVFLCIHSYTHYQPKSVLGKSKKLAHPDQSKAVKMG